MGQNLIVMPSTKARYEAEALYGLVGVTTQVRLYRKRVRFTSRMIRGITVRVETSRDLIRGCI